MDPVGGVLVTDQTQGTLEIHDLEILRGDLVDIWGENGQTTRHEKKLPEEFLQLLNYDGENPQWSHVEVSTNCV